MSTILETIGRPCRGSFQVAHGLRTGPRPTPTAFSAPLMITSARMAETSTPPHSITFGLVLWLVRNEKKRGRVGLSPLRSPSSFFKRRALNLRPRRHLFTTDGRQAEGDRSRRHDQGGGFWGGRPQARHQREVVQPLDERSLR